MHTATIPLPQKRESSQILCRPKGDTLSHWIPVCAGMGNAGSRPELNIVSKELPMYPYSLL